MKRRTGRAAGAMRIIVLIVVTIAATGCTQSTAPSPLAGRWSSEAGQRVYQIDNSGTLTLATIDYPSVKGLAGIWTHASNLLTLTWADGTIEEFGVQLDASVMTWTKGSLSTRLAKVSEADYPAFAIQAVAPSDPAYTLGSTDHYSIGAGASTSLTESLYKSSLAARNYTAAIVVMTADAAGTDANTATYSCDIYVPVP